MSDENTTLLSPIMDVIKAQFIEEFGAKGYRVYDYEDDPDQWELPAILLQLNGLEGVENTIPGMFRANCMFTAFICESFKGNAKTRVRDTAFDVAHFVNGKFWGDLNTFSKAKFELAEEEPFNEKVDNAEIWRVDWQQQIYIQ